MKLILFNEILIKKIENGDILLAIQIINKVIEEILNLRKMIQELNIELSENIIQKEKASDNKDYLLVISKLENEIKDLKQVNYYKKQLIFN